MISMRTDGPSSSSPTPSSLSSSSPSSSTSTSPLPSAASYYTDAFLLVPTIFHPATILISSTFYSSHLALGLVNKAKNISTAASVFASYLSFSSFSFNRDTFSNQSRTSNRNRNNRITANIPTSISSVAMAIATAAVATAIGATEASFHNLDHQYNLHRYHEREIASASSHVAERALITGTTSPKHEHIHSIESSSTSASSSLSSSLSSSSSSSSAAMSTSSAYSTIHCPTTYQNITLPETEIYCNWTWDKFLCWPPTEPGKIVHLPCPPGHGIDVTKFAERRCGWDGRWEGKPSATTLPQDTNVNGWTNYTPCYTPEILELMKKVYAGGNGDIVKIKFDIVERTRTLEIVGLMLSLFALLFSLIIFCNFRSLRNNRTKIHKNLFVAMVIQVLIRLTLYLDQAIIRRGHEIAGNGSTNGIENTPYLCEASYILLEYARTAMFMWMFIEGLYLHNVITVTVFQGRFPHTLYVIIGWGGPILMTAIWAFFTARYKGQEKCWWNYNLTPYYWILEGPRLAVILFNFFFLLNIIRVLIVKLRQSHTSDVEQVRKAVRAAVVLLPLLGITNLLHMTEAPLDKTAWEFALWSYVTHFLRSFQGLFIAMIYCFLNGEVRAALLKSISVYMSIHGHPNWAPRRTSMFSAAYNTAPETDGHESMHRRESSINRAQGSNYNVRSRSWMMTLCFRGQKVLREPPISSLPPETNV